MYPPPSSSYCIYSNSIVFHENNFLWHLLKCFPVRHEQKSTCSGSKKTNCPPWFPNNPPPQIKNKTHLDKTSWDKSKFEKYCLMKNVLVTHPTWFFYVPFSLIPQKCHIFINFWEKCPIPSSYITSFSDVNDDQDTSYRVIDPSGSIILKSIVFLPSVSTWHRINTGLFVCSIMKVEDGVVH